MEVGSIQVISVAGTVLMLLLSGNIYFVKKLVDKIERSAHAFDKQAIQVSKISEGMNALGIQLRDLKLDVKDLRRVEIDVAVLKAQLNPAKAASQRQV